MKSQWNVTQQNIRDTKHYAVYRLRDTSKPIHSGNVEMGSPYYNSRQGARYIADLMNAMPNACTACWLYTNVAIYDACGNTLAIYPMSEEVTT